MAWDHKQRTRHGTKNSGACSFINLFNREEVLKSGPQMEIHNALSMK